MLGMISLKCLLLIDIVNLIFRPAIAVMPAGGVYSLSCSSCPDENPHIVLSR